MTEKCTICEKDIGDIKYAPMEEWSINGNICSKCYSQKLEEHYPGKHIRTNRLENSEQFLLITLFVIFMTIKTIPCQ